MANYTKATNFATKDALVSGDPLKVVKGTEIDDEFNAIETAVQTKADIASPTLTGIPRAPTSATGTNTTQIATTAFVQAQIAADLASLNLTNKIGANEIINNSVGADELDINGDGVAGQFLISDGDGSFSWTAIAFLSPSTTDPVTRDDGTALVQGDLYYNTTDDALKTYDGSSWSASSSSTAPDPSTGVVPVGGVVMAQVYTTTGSSVFATARPVGYQFTCSSSQTIKTQGVYWGVSGTDSNFLTTPSDTITHNYGTWAVLGSTGDNTPTGSTTISALLAMRVA